MTGKIRSGSHIRIRGYRQVWSVDRMYVRNGVPVIFAVQGARTIEVPAADCQLS